MSHYVKHCTHSTYLNTHTTYNTTFTIGSKYLISPLLIDDKFTSISFLGDSS